MICEAALRLILSIFFIISVQVILNTEAKAQTPEAASPSVRIEYKVKNPFGMELSDNGACPGALATFKAVVSDVGSKEKLRFNWTLSAGKIISGQGTSKIIASTEGADGQEVTATVEVTAPGFKPEYKETASATLLTAICCLPPCPTISIYCPAYASGIDKSVNLSVNLSGGDPDVNPKYNWKVSAGKIISGQGTPNITVDATRAEGQDITATVELDGLAPECDRVRSCTLTRTIVDPPAPTMLDEYEDVSWINEETRLNNFNIQIQNYSPDAVGYIIIYGPRGVDKYLARIRKFLVGTRHLNPDRIMLTNGGYGEKPKVELWVVPKGANLPTPNPRF